jgi:hypothetical protein
MLAFIGLAVVVLLVALLVYAAMKPDTLRTQRSATITHQAGFLEAL